MICFLALLKYDRPSGYQMLGFKHVHKGVELLGGPVFDETDLSKESMHALLLILIQSVENFHVQFLFYQTAEDLSLSYAGAGPCCSLLHSFLTEGLTLLIGHPAILGA